MWCDGDCKGWCHGAERERLVEELEANTALRTIQGQVIPIVREYEYLGISIHDSLSLDAIVEDRKAKGKRALYALLPFLQNVSIPLSTRTDVLRAVVLPSLLYGAELWGSDAKRAATCQTVVNEGLRWCLGLPGRSTRASTSAMFRELNMAPVAASALHRVCRAVKKFPSLKTWIADLMAAPAPPAARKGSWVSAARTRAQRALGQCHGPADTVLDAEWRRMEDGGRSQKTAKAASLYKWSRFVGTRASRPAFLWLPDAGRGLTHLAQMRVGAFLTGIAESHAHERAGTAARTEICRFCGGGEHADARETYAHLVVSCPAWADQHRTFGLHNHIRCAFRLLRQTNGRCTGSNVLTLLLGGAVRGAKLADWDFVKDHGVHYVSDSDDSDADSNSDRSGGNLSDSTGQLDAQDRCCYAMARFLNAVRLRRFSLDKLRYDAGEAVD